MHTASRKLLCFSIALILAFTPLLRAEQQTTPPAAPIPSQITSAHTIFVSNGGGPNYFNAFTGGADRAYNSFYAALRQWNRYQFVDSPSQADLIFEIRSIAPVSGTDGTGSLVYNPQLILRILDPKTNAVLWTTTANVRAAGRQKTRDTEFDQSVAVLVDKLGQTTGEKLSATQLKDISDNSKWSTRAKVFLGVAIGLAAVGTGVFAYEATQQHLKTPTLPTLPPCADPPFCPVTAAR